MDLGTKIRKLRKRQRRTLKDIAESGGFTPSLLSKIENGKTMPPVSTLSRIAEALGVTFAILLDGSDREGPVHTPAAAVKAAGLVKTDRGYRFFPFAVERPTKQMQPFLFEVEKGKVRRQALSHSGEEFIYVLTGRIKFRVGNVEYRLDPGDSLYFDSEEEHEVTPVSHKALYLAIFHEPPSAEEQKHSGRRGAAGKGKSKS